MYLKNVTSGVQTEKKLGSLHSQQMLEMVASSVTAMVSRVCLPVVTIAAKILA